MAKRHEDPDYVMFLGIVTLGMSLFMFWVILSPSPNRGYFLHFLPAPIAFAILGCFLIWIARQTGKFTHTTTDEE